MNTRFIEKEIIDKIKETAVLEDVVASYIDLKPAGSQLIGDCPKCGGKKKFNIYPDKKNLGRKAFKCFPCDTGGNDAVSFLTQIIGMGFVDALKVLADRYNISLETEEEQPRKNRGNRRESFRDEQLRNSGISHKAQIYHQTKGEASYEMDRYQKGTIDRSWNVIPGDDMILNYVDFDFAPITYKNHRGKQTQLIRVRWANPALHKDKNGTPIKYQSPYQSGSHLWLPNKLILAYKTNEIIETLYITEGEKKADKMCIEGMMTVGIMGIHNFAAEGNMPHHFESLIRRCGVQNVVFILDSDWQDVSIKPNKPIDSRPMTFFKAVLKFRNYFAAYANEGIFLRTYFAYGKSEVYKGIDDLLVRELAENTAALKEDFAKAIVDREGQGEYINVHELTSMSDYQLKEFWNLHSRPEFMKAHKDKLKALPEFKFGKYKYRYNEEEDTFAFDLCQRLSDVARRKIYNLIFPNVARQLIKWALLNFISRNFPIAIFKKKILAFFIRLYKSGLPFKHPAQFIRTKVLAATGE